MQPHGTSNRRLVRQLVSHPSRLQYPKSQLPELVVSTAAVLFERVAELNARIDEVDKQMRLLVRENEELRRLTTIPGVGEMSALGVHAFAPSMDSFARGRDFAAWIGLTPREISTGGRQRLGRITKMGQRDLRQLLVLAQLRRFGVRTFGKSMG